MRLYTQQEHNESTTKSTMRAQQERNESTMTKSTATQYGRQGVKNRKQIRKVTQQICQQLRNNRNLSDGSFMRKGRCEMKGYDTDSGYMGYVNGRYVLFASESDYIDYCSE